MKNESGVLEQKLKSYYENMDISGYREIFTECIKEYRGENFNRILDIGAGIGSFYDAVEPFGCEVYALESSEYGINRMQEKNIIVTPFFLNNCNSLPYEDSFFSCVIFNQVIEHVDKEVGQFYIKEIIRVLELGGVAIIKSPSRYCNIWNTDPHHIYCWRPHELLDEVSKYKCVDNVKIQRLPLEPWMFFDYNDKIIDYWHKYNKKPLLRKFFYLSGRLLDSMIFNFFKSDIMVSVSNVTFIKK